MVLEDPLDRVAAAVSQVFGAPVDGIKKVMAGTQATALIAPELVEFGHDDEIPVDMICRQADLSSAALEERLGSALEGGSIPDFIARILIARHNIEGIYHTLDLTPDQIVYGILRVADQRFFATDSVEVVPEKEFLSLFGEPVERIREYAKQGIIRPLLRQYDNWVLKPYDFSLLVSGEARGIYQAMIQTTLGGRILKSSKLPGDAVCFPLLYARNAHKINPKGRCNFPKPFRGLLPYERGESNCIIAHDANTQETYIFHPSLRNCIDDRFDQSMGRIDAFGRMTRMNHFFAPGTKVEFQGGNPYITLTQVDNNPLG